MPTAARLACLAVPDEHLPNKKPPSSGKPAIMAPAEKPRKAFR
jgi:hypothetical protein